MIIVGADYHPGFQQIAFVDTGTGEVHHHTGRDGQQPDKVYRELELRVHVGRAPSGR